MANALTYIKNVGKSIGYTSFEALKKTNPVFSEFAETNRELATDMYKSVRNIKKRLKGTPNKIMESKYGKFGQTYLDNLVDDLKTGKFYNKERIDSSLDFVGEDFDFDFGGSDDFDIGGFEDSYDEPSANEMMDLVAEKASTAISTTMTRTAEYIVQSNTESTRAMYNQMNAIYGGIHTGMSTINQNIAKILEFSTGPVVTHFENSSTFYTEITRMDQERNQYLKDILENVKNINNPPKKEQYKSSSTRYSDLVSFDGVLDISRYIENVKKNIKNSTGMLGMLDMMFDPDFASQFTSSPVSAIMELLMTAMIPGNIKKSTEKLNKSFSGLFGNLMMGLKEKGKYFGIWDTIASIFGINTSIKKLDPKDYEKGKIPFDGVTKKAITEVIPTYLSKILVAITKKPQDETRFDYENGKFVKVSDLKDLYDSITKDSANRAAWEMDSVIRTKKRGLSFRNKDEERQFDEDWESLKLYLYKNQKDFNTRDKKLTGKSFGLKGGMASDINVRLFQELLDGTSEKISYAHNLFREIDDQNRRMLELQDSSTYTALVNGSVDLSSLSADNKESVQENQYKSNNKKDKKKKGKAYNKAQETINKNAGLGQDTIDKESEVARIMANAKKEAPINEDKQSFSQRMNSASGLSAKIAVLVESASELAKKPAKFVVSMLDKADERLYDLIYGPKDDKTGRKSFVGRIFGGLEKIFNNFSNFMDEHIIEPFKKVFSKENMKDATKKLFNAFGIDIESLVKDVRVKLFGTKNEKGDREGGIFGKFINDFKDGFKGAFDWVKGAFKSVGDWFGVTSKKNAKGQAKEQQNTTINALVNAFSNASSNITEAATGIKKVNKTGLAVISEGEMIVPPDMNPFNIMKRQRNEKNVKDKLKSDIDSIVGYAEGDPSASTDKKSKKDSIIQKMFNRWIKETEGMSDKEKAEFFKSKANNKAFAKYKDDISEFAKSQKQKFTKGDYEDGRNPLLDRMFEEASNLWKAIRNTTNTFGMSDEDVDKFKKNATDFIGNIKGYGGTMAAGATIGAGLSLVTGFLGGPLVGAAVGAGVGLIKKSETIQNLLFGKIGKDGEREGSKLISKELQQNIKKFLPDMAKGAAVGGILTALPIIPGGPVAGIIVGSALGFAKNSQGIQDLIFGENGLGLNKEEFEKKIKGVIPKMGVGAIAGLLAGPFGSVTTNLILGSALGFASDTNTFKDLMFGKEVDGVREGGLLRDIANPVSEFFTKTFKEFKIFMEKDMLDPIRNAMKPIANQFRLLGERFTENLGNMIKEKIGQPIEDTIKKFLLNPLGKFFGSVFKAAMKPAKFVLSAPSKTIGAIGERFRIKDVRRGQARYMSAAQRNALRKSKGYLRMGGSDDFLEQDESLENASYQDIDDIRTTLSSVMDARRGLSKSSHDSYKRIYNQMYSKENSGVKTHVKKAALDMVRHGNYEQAMTFIKSADIEDSSKNKLLETVAKESARMKLAKTYHNDADSLIPKVVEEAQKRGIKLDPEKLKDPKYLQATINNLGSELKYKDKGETINLEQKNHNETIDVLKDIRDILAGKQIDHKKFQHKDELQKQQDRYSFVAGLVDDPDKENADMAESDSLRGKIRGAVSNKRSELEKKTQTFKGVMSETIGDIRNAAAQFVTDVKNTKLYKKYLGDDNKDYLDDNLHKITDDGLSIKLRKTGDGEVEPDISDSNTKKSLKTIEERHAVNVGILTGLTALPTSLGNLFGNLFGKKKDKEEKSIFDKILDFFTGEGTITLGTVLKGAIPAALLALGITGKLDKIANALTGGAFGSKDSNDTIMAKDSNGNNVEVLLNEKGEPVTDAEGKYVSVTGEILSSDTYLHNTNAVSTMSLSDRLKYNLVRGTLTGKGSVVGAAVKSNKLFKAGKALATGKKTGDGMIKTIMKTATDKSVLYDILNSISSKLDSFIKALSNAPILKRFVNTDKLSELSTSLLNFIKDNLPEAGAKLTKIASGLKAAAGVLAGAMVVIDFTTGMQDTSTTLKISEEYVTNPQRILCGLIRAFKNAIPVIGTFIPDQAITNFFIDHVAKWFGISKTELTKQRDEAQAELDAYNAENGTNYTWADYNKKVLGNYTWTEKIGNTVGSFVTNVKSKGFKGTMSSIGSSIKNSKVGQAVGKAGQWIGDKAGNIKDKATGFLTPVFDEVSRRINFTKDIGSYTINVVKDTWKEMISGNEIDSDNLHIDENDPNGSYKKIIYNLVKILGIVPSGIIKLGKGVWNHGIKPIVDGVKTIGSGVGTTVKNLFTSAWNGDLIGAFTDRSGDSQSGNLFLDSVSSSLNGTARVLLTMPTLLTSAVGLVVRNFDNIVSGIKTIGSGVGTTVANMFTSAWKGDLIGAFTDRSGNAQTGNIFLDSVSGAINGTARVTLAVPTLLTSVVGGAVNKVKDFVKAIADAGTLSAEDQSILDRSNNGELGVFTKEYWKVSTHLTGPAGAFNTFISIMKKIFNLPSALIANISPSNLLEKATNKLAEWFGIDDSETGRGSSLAGRGSGAADTFISQVDPRYRNKKFNIAGDTQAQTLGDTGCAPAAAAMAVNATLGTKYATMEDASRLALKYKVKDDGVNASYFNDEFARHGIYAKYITDNKSQEITRQLMNNNKVVLMGQDISNKSKDISPFGPNPHYVVATGLSKDGKYIYINDPESRTPNIRYSANKILDNSKLGIAATVARGSKSIANKFRKYIGRGAYGPETVQYKVWNALRAAGYNEIAVAAAMGNIEHESRFNVSAIEKGSGAGFGLIQWTDSRRTAIENYARQKGVSVSSLELQLEYLIKELQSGSGVWTNASSKYGFGTLRRSDWANGTDLVKATKAFMCCFERPDYNSNINHIDRRISAAKEYYEAFTGTAIDVNIDYGTSEPTTSSSSTGSLGFIAEMLGAFNDLGKAYKIRDNFWSPEEETSSSNSSDYYTSGNYYSGSANGNVSTNPEYANLQRALVDKMYSIQGTLKYAQDNDRYPGSRNPDVINPDGSRSGDCSSTVRWAYQKILGIDPGSWTGAQRDNENTYTVATSTADESKLQLGDLLLKDGHVEMYAGNNTMIGHGGGKDGKQLGPVVSTLNKSGAYNLVRRYIKFKGTGSGLFGRGSDVHPTNTPYDSALRYINPEQYTSILPFGLDDVDNNNNKVPEIQYNSNNKVENVSVKTSQKPKYTGRASQIEISDTAPRNNDIVELVKSIIKLLVQIVTNTDQLNNIVNLLGEYITATTTSDNSKESQKTAILAKQNLINAMQKSSSNEPNAQLMRLIEATERIARE